MPWLAAAKSLEVLGVGKIELALGQSPNSSDRGDNHNMLPRLYRL